MRQFSSLIRISKQVRLCERICNDDVVDKFPQNDVRLCQNSQYIFFYHTDMYHSKGTPYLYHQNMKKNLGNNNNLRDFYFYSDTQVSNGK